VIDFMPVRILPTGNQKPFTRQKGLETELESSSVT
jgi:hypothetical protein